jgi:hypothetical protein
MKIFFTFLAFLVSTVIFAQNNPAGQQNTATVSSAVSSGEKNIAKKVHYVDKRTRNVQPGSKGNSSAHKNCVRKTDTKKSK